MKGVVRPQAMPTRRKPSVQRKTEGDGVAGSELGVGVEDESEAVAVEVIDMREVMIGRVEKLEGEGSFRRSVELMSTVTLCLNLSIVPTDCRSNDESAESWQVGLVEGSPV